VGLVVFVVVNGVVGIGCGKDYGGGVMGLIEIVIAGVYSVFALCVLVWSFFGALDILDRNRENRRRSPRVSFREGQKPLGMVSAGRVPVRSPSGAFICSRCGHEWKPRSSKLVVCPRCKLHN
jgi:hypothetical protein